MGKYFLDTNIFLRTLIREDEISFQECCRLLKAVKLNRIKAITANIVLAEIVWTLSSYYHFPKKEVVRAAKSIANLRGLKIIDDYDLSVALGIFESKNVRYIDCLIASIRKIQAKNWIIISYDQDFDKLNVLKKEPKEVLALLSSTK